MATMHATASYRNATRSLMAYLVAQGITPLVPDGDEKFNSDRLEEWVRVTTTALPETYAGKIVDSGTTRKASMAMLLVQADVFVRGTSTSGGSRIDDVDALAEKVAHALRYADVVVKDYVADATGATATAATLRFTAPTSQRADPTTGWLRRIVQAEGRWVLRHAE
jgi:hypothetical protein